MRELLLRFFEKKQYAGWKNIADALIDKGECVVSGETSIWWGGIGNFIETEKAEGFIDCLKYKFDLEDFKKSDWFKEQLELFLSEKIKEKHEITDKLASINFQIVELKINL